MRGPAARRSAARSPPSPGSPARSPRRTRSSSARPLSPIQRQALVRAAVRRAAPRLLSRSAARPGFVPAADRLIAELQAALRRSATRSRADGRAARRRRLRARAGGDLYRLRRAARRQRGAPTAARPPPRRSPPSAPIPGGWGGRPVFVYGFDDLTRDQIELRRARSPPARDVTVAVAYADTRALSARAGLVNRLVDEYGAERPEPLPFDPGYTSSATLRHLDRNLFEPSAARDRARRRPHAARLRRRPRRGRGDRDRDRAPARRRLRARRDRDRPAPPGLGGPVLASVLGALGIPVALEASAPISATCVGTSLIALCRAAADESAPSRRCSPTCAPIPSLTRARWTGSSAASGAARATTVSAATESWETPPRHLRAPARGADAAARAARARPLARASWPRGRIATARRSPAARGPAARRSRPSSCARASPQPSSSSSSPSSARCRASRHPPGRGDRGARVARRSRAGAGPRRAACGS